MVGEHIRILKDGRWVHAIDCGDETVLHLVVESPPPRVRRAYRPEFVAGAAAVEIVRHRERTFPAKAIVQRAYSRASDPALASMFRDSEAFVDWCTTGRLSATRNVAHGVPGVPAAPAPAVAPSKPAPPAAAGAVAKAPTAKAKAAAPASRPKAKAKARTKVKPKGAARVKAKATRRASRPAPPRPAKRKLPTAKPVPRRGSKPARKGKR